MKIIDCFMYFDEDHLLEIRLNTLYNFVDKFVIVEANLDHAGNHRKPQFNISDFAKLKNKIHYILLKDLPSHNNFYKKNWGPAWRRENLQRNALSKGYEDCNPDDLIMISDLDEIPNPFKISEFKTDNKLACFVQGNFLLKFNLLNVTEPNWYGTRMCRKRDLKSPQWLREIKTGKIAFYKFYKPRFDKFIHNGGWHFSSVKNSKGIYKKLNSYAEQQWNNDKFKDMAIIEKKIEERKDLFDRHDFKTIKIDNSFPKYLSDNKDRFKSFIYEV